MRSQMSVAELLVVGVLSLLAGCGGTAAPTVPTGLAYTKVSGREVDLSWTASSINTAGYKIYRGGTQIGTSTGLTYVDISGNPNTAYSYTVVAYDAARSTSAQSSALAVTTGHEYFVSPTGNDANDGSMAHPWQHIVWATCAGLSGSLIATVNPNSLVAGDILYVRAGTYFEYNIDEKNNGTATRPVTIKSYQNEVAVVDGAGGNDSNASLGVFTFGELASSAYVVLDGLTIQNGRNNGVLIGYSLASHHITVQNCIITGWRFVDGGNCGGISVNRSYSNVIVRNCTIIGDDTNNMNYNGVHIMFGDGTLIVANCDISHAYAGITYKHAADGAGPTIIENNFIHNNKAGITIASDHCFVRNNLVINNTLNGIYTWANAGGPKGCYNTFSHNTVYNSVYTVGVNSGGGSFDVDGHYGGTSNTFTNNALYGINGELSTFFIWPSAEVAHQNHSEHDTFSDYNNYYNSVGTNVIDEFSHFYTLAQWKAFYPALDVHSVQGQPIFTNGSGALNQIADFALTSGSPGYHAASDGTDMGANIALVGLQSGVE